MNKKQVVIIWGILLGLSLLMYSNNINQPLKGRHSWAQADHYAITLQFLEKDADFFHPKTYCLNPQFQPTKASEKLDYWNYSLANPEGITAIDFPIHHYLIATCMKLFGTSSPLVSKCYFLLLSLLGLFYLSKTTFLLSNSFFYSCFILVFAFLSPMFSFYATGFLPSSAALSLLFIASYWFVKYQKNAQFKHFTIAIFFITLAALTRFPFVIYILALLGTCLFLYFFQKKKRYKIFFTTLIGLFVVMGYFSYNKFYLSENFGSNFLNYPMPAKSFSAFFTSISGTIHHEVWRYFTPIHYAILAYLGWILIKNRANITQLKTSSFTNIHLIITTLGVIAYSYLMILQFVAHDYYLLDTFFPIILFWMIACFPLLPIEKIKTQKKLLLVLLISGIFFQQFIYQIGYKAREKDPLEITRKNFENSDKILDSLKIPKSAKILLIDSKSPNLAFTQMKRKGFCVMKVNRKTLQQSFNWKFDYIITQNFTYKEVVLKNDPNFEKNTETIFNNRKFTIHIKK